MRNIWMCGILKDNFSESIIKLNDFLVNRINIAKNQTLTKEAMGITKVQA